MFSRGPITPLVCGFSLFVFGSGHQLPEFVFCMKPRLLKVTVLQTKQSVDTSQHCQSLILVFCFDKSCLVSVIVSSKGECSITFSTRPLSLGRLVPVSRVSPPHHTPSSELSQYPSDDGQQPSIPSVEINYYNRNRTFTCTKGRG